MGLGLTICKNVLKALNGKIKCKSKLNTGKSKTYKSYEMNNN